MPGEMVLELEAGWLIWCFSIIEYYKLTLVICTFRALRKTSHILLCLSQIIDTPSTNTLITYYALDLEKCELEHTLKEISMLEIGSDLQGKVDTKGFLGTYDDGLKFLQCVGLRMSTVVNGFSKLSIAAWKVNDSVPSPSLSSSGSDSSGTPVSDITPPSMPEESQPPLHVMFLGSSLGNFNWADSGACLRLLPLRPGSIRFCCFIQGQLHYFLIAFTSISFLLIGYLQSKYLMHQPLMWPNNGLQNGSILFI